MAKDEDEAGVSLCYYPLMQQVKVQVQVVE